MNRRKMLELGLRGAAAAAVPNSVAAATTGSRPTAAGAPPIEVHTGDSSTRVEEAVLFPFDDHSIPFTRSLKLELIMGKTPGRPNPIVLRPGQPGEPDSESVRYYGTVIQFGDELRMWYLGRGDKDIRLDTYLSQRLRKKSVSSENEPTNPLSGPLHLLYAVSKDGINWDKPKLGLVEYNGTTQNNLVDLMGGKFGIAEVVVLCDPDDPNPARKFKMVFEAEKYKNGLAVAFSPDGLRWTESPLNPVGPTLEESGLIKFDGCYYVSGQGYGVGRRMMTMASYDFEHWTQSGVVSFSRGPSEEVPLDRWNTVEEVHLGASLVNRGNVILGIYGMWHGTPSSDRSFVEIDLGLVVSNDALHYREPVPNFRFVPNFEELEVPFGRAPALAQGQGMINLGEKTLFWYEAWPWDSGSVRLATWERDRLGYFHVRGKLADPHLISCPLKLNGARAQLFVNADGLSDTTELTVELLDREFRPISGYSGADCLPVRTSGLRQAVAWRGKNSLGPFSHPVRVRVIFGGVRPEDAKLFAVYVSGK